jgi:hypothetical protein
LASQTAAATLALTAAPSAAVQVGRTLSATLALTANPPQTALSVGRTLATTMAITASRNAGVQWEANRFASSIFSADFNQPIPGSEVPETIPGSEGGVIEAVKRAVVMALREALVRTNITVNGSPVYVDLEYPMKKEQYPGIWVQFSVVKLNRAGISHEVWVQDANLNWTPIQEWMFNGRVTLTIVALKSLERDRIADSIISMFAFSRTPELVISQPNANTKQYRTLLTALDQNPYVAMTLNTDTITPGGQTASMDVPWQQDVLAYEDSYSFDLLGNFNIKFTRDGAYTLSRVDSVPVIDYDAINQPYWPRSL